MEKNAELIGPDEDGEFHSASDDALGSTVLVEVAHGVVAAFGDLPAGIGLKSLDLTLLTDTDRELISTAVASLGNASSVVGNLANAAENAKGLFRLSDATLAQMLRNGGTLAVKDGANLGAIVIPGGGLAQARFIPVSAAGVATLAASAGPAIAMLALQSSLNQLNDLARTNIALTSQVLTEVRQASWSELNGLVHEVETATDRARRAGAVTDNLWSTIASKGADLRTQRHRYKIKVGDHAGQLSKLKDRARREYLETNAEAIVFDTHALLSSLMAWVGYQAMYTARERAAGSEDSAETRVAKDVLQETKSELEAALGEITALVGALTRELRLVAELPGRSTLAGAKRRKDAKSSRLTSSQLLEAIQPLTDQLIPPVGEPRDPDVLCLPAGVQQDKYLKVLHLLLEPEESVHAVALPYQLKDGQVVGELLQSVTVPVGEKLARRVGGEPDRGTTIVAVTDRRILASRSKLFLRTGELNGETPIEQVRYVRRSTDSEGNARDRIDLITRDTNVRWVFHHTTDPRAVDALAAVLAESMSIPDSERASLVEQRKALTSPTAESAGLERSESPYEESVE